MAPHYQFRFESCNKFMTIGLERCNKKLYILYGAIFMWFVRIYNYTLKPL